MIDPKNPYELIRIDQNKENDAIMCDVCLGEDDEEGDEIVVCDLCWAGVHQSCHGGMIKNQLPPAD